MRADVSPRAKPGSDGIAKPGSDAIAKPEGYISLTPKQSNIYEWGWQAGARFRQAVCGRRFGKTFLVLAEMQRAYLLARDRGVHPDNEIWYGAPTLGQAKRVFWRKLKRAIPAAWLAGKPLETELSIPLKGGYVIRVVGLDHYQSLRGSGLWFFVGDEWSDCPAAAWQEVISPMLATAGGHALKIGTPKGFDHFYRDFCRGLPGGEPDHRSWQYTTLQGGNVPATEIARQRALLDPRVFRQEYEATFESFAGRVFYGFSRAQSVRACPVVPGLPLHIGMDFNINPMSATVWQEQGRDLCQIDEIVLPTSNTDEMAGEIRRRYERPGFGDDAGAVDHITIYPDPAGAQRRTSARGRTDIGILREAGFRVRDLRAHPAVRDRINVMNAKFLTADGERHAFVDPKCRLSIEAYERLVYRAGTNEPDKTGGYDHLADASGYYIYTRFSQPEPAVATVPFMRR